MADQLSEVEKIHFRGGVNTTGFLKSMAGTLTGTFVHPKEGKEGYYRDAPAQPPFTKQVETKIEYPVNFTVAIKDLDFVDGAVIFDKKLPRLGKVTFQIYNDDIKASYDAVKNYFAGLLNTKKIVVDATVYTLYGIINGTSAVSKEIEAINKDLIDNVKYSIIKTIGRTEAATDRSIFTLEELQDVFGGEDLKGQNIFKDEYEVLEILMQRSKAKHYNHLRYLSSKHRGDLFKLRFVHNPFSFIFLLSDNEHFYIVWETLDTEEATYIWDFPAEPNRLNQIMSRLDELIGLIASEGRNEYRHRKETNFRYVIHNYKDTNSGFIDWKKEIDEVAAIS